MSGMNAWVLDFGADYRAAVGGRELLHLIDVPAPFVVPCTPRYCHSVVFWQGRLLPVMNVAGRLGGNNQDAQFIAVVGYQKIRGEYPQFGALQLVRPPAQLSVSDDQACNLPENKQCWSELSISCFKYHDEAIPVLNLNCLFDPLN